MAIYQVKIFLNSSIQPIHETLTGTTAPNTVDLGVIAIKLHTPELEADHQIQFSVLTRTPPLGRILAPQQGIKSALF